MYKLNNRHIVVVNKYFSKALSSIIISEQTYTKNHSGLYNNIIKKNYVTINFNFLKKFIKVKRNRGELIIHPEYIDSNDKNSTNTKRIQNKYEIKEDQEYDELISSCDEDLDFIKLDKNGVPIIKSNFYESLGVEQTAPPKEIKKNFLKIAKKYHPDKHPESLVRNIFLKFLDLLYLYLQRPRNSNGCS